MFTFGCRIRIGTNLAGHGIVTDIERKGWEAPDHIFATFTDGHTTAFNVDQMVALA